MNKNIILSSLNEVANILDSKQFYSQAETLTNLMIKIAQSEDEKVFVTTGKEIDVDGKKVRIPSGIKLERTFDNKKFKLMYDPSSKQIFYKQVNGKLSIPLDFEMHMKEVKSPKVDLWKSSGLRRIFGDWRLPNLSKSIPLEPYFRKELIPDIASVVRPAGDVLKENLTKPVTDALGTVADDFNIGVPGRDKPHEADAKFQLEQSKDRTPVSRETPDTAVEVKPEMPEMPELAGLEEVTQPNIEPTLQISDFGTRIPRKTLKEIQSPNDLLFWSMMYVNDMNFDNYDQSEEKNYYTKENKSQIQNYINKLTSSKYVYKINPKIKGFKEEAIRLLNNRTASTLSKRQVVSNNEKTSMNKIEIIKRLNKIAQILDDMNMPEQADDVTDVMENISDSPEKIAWTNYARTLAKKDPDFIPPIKPKVSTITFASITDKALSEYHRFKENKKQPYKFTLQEETQLKLLAENADRAR